MLQFTGFWMALVTFLGIWGGHVGVRWLEAHTPTIQPPMIILLTMGIGLNIFSLFASSVTMAGVSSIIGITLIWDAFELYRQEKRIIKGHARANPNNPRHAAFLAAGKGVTEDLLDRDPRDPTEYTHVERPSKPQSPRPTRTSMEYMEVEA